VRPHPGGEGGLLSEEALDARLDVSALGSVARSAFSGQYLVLRRPDLSRIPRERLGQLVAEI
jgi:hypothetical protein